MIRPPPSSPLFPYPTLFRSDQRRGTAVLRRDVARVDAGPEADLPPGWRATGGRLVGRREGGRRRRRDEGVGLRAGVRPRSEEHTSELQSQSNLVCRLLLEKK